MRQNHTINRADVDKILGDVKPLSSMTHEIGMAAVAAELHLGIDELELDAANSVERGAAALFLAGFGPKPAASLPAVEPPRAADAKPDARRAQGDLGNRRGPPVDSQFRGVGLGSSAKLGQRGLDLPSLRLQK